MNKSSIVAVLLLVILTFAAYGNSLQNGFVWDDTVYILDSEAIKSWNIFLEVFKSPARHVSIGETLDLSRPLMAFSLLVDYSMWGETPFGYHLSNLFLHLINSILLFFLSMAIFGSVPVSFISAAIFSIHPIHSEAVVPVTFREDLLAAVFYLLTLISYIKGELKSGGGKWRQWCFALLFMTAALLSKEMAITIPITILLFRILVSSKDGMKTLFERDFVVFFSLMAAICLVYLHFLYSIYSNLPSSFYSGYPAGSLYSTFLTLPLIAVYYIKLLVLPLSLLADYTFPVVRSAFSPLFLLPAVFLLSIGLWARFLMARERFMLLCFFMSLLPVSNLVPTFNLLAERFLYIPSIFFALFVSSLAYNFWKRLSSPTGTVVTALFIATSLAFIVCLIERNGIWKSDYMLWHDTLKKNSSSFIARNNLGNIYRSKGDYDRAVSEYREAIVLQSGNADVHFNLGLVYYDLMEYDKALSKFINARGLEPENVQYIVNVGGIYGMLGDNKKAARAFRDALRIDPQNSMVRENLRRAEREIARGTVN